MSSESEADRLALKAVVDESAAAPDVYMDAPPFGFVRVLVGAGTYWLTRSQARRMGLRDREHE